MFYKHRFKAIKRQLAETQGKLEAQQKYIRELEAQTKKLRDDYKFALKASEKMSEVISERNKLFAENVKMKRDELSLRRDLNELGEMISVAAQRIVCPEDCANKKNFNGCRTCTRYPKSVDKYVHEVSE